MDRYEQRPGKRKIEVNPRKILTLTDFENRVFVGEFAKNRDFCGGAIKKCTPVYHARVKHAAPVRGLFARGDPC